MEQVEGQISFESVCFCYPQRPDALVLKSISLTIPAGKTTAFVGSSGSGKLLGRRKGLKGRCRSTMISLLLRFYFPESGRIKLDGTDVASLDLTWLRSKMALVEQVGCPKVNGQSRL